MQNKYLDNFEEQQEGMLNKYALVLTSIKGIGVKTFSYLIPDEMKPIIKIGHPVLVPFGRMGLINAYVVGFSNYLEEGIKAKNISKILETLSDKEAEVLKYRFGLEGYKAMSLKEVGDVFNLTKERIRQIEKKAIKRLQHPTRAKKLASYIA